MTEKPKLRLEDLEVESFETVAHAAGLGGGTVQGHASENWVCYTANWCGTAAADCNTNMVGCVGSIGCTAACTFDRPTCSPCANYSLDMTCSPEACQNTVGEYTEIDPCYSGCREDTGCYSAVLVEEACTYGECEEKLWTDVVCCITTEGPN